jgi:hypothetical protein
VIIQDNVMIRKQPMRAKAIDIVGNETTSTSCHRFWSNNWNFGNYLCKCGIGDEVFIADLATIRE